MEIDFSPRMEAFARSAFTRIDTPPRMRNLRQSFSSAWTQYAGLRSRSISMLPGARETGELNIRILKTPRERRAISELRKHAAFSVERDLGVNLASAEAARDDLGIVAAVYRRTKLIATMRVVPVGQRLTAIENLPADLLGDERLLDRDCWEIGRTIMAVDDRSPELLMRCMVLAFRKLIELEEVSHLHATTTRPLARLWRRFGFQQAAAVEGASGEQYVVIHATKHDVAAALREPAGLAAARSPTPHAFAVPGLRSGHSLALV